MNCSLQPVETFIQSDLSNNFPEDGVCKRASLTSVLIPVYILS